MFSFNLKDSFRKLSPSRRAAIHLLAITFATSSLDKAYYYLLPYLVGRNVPVGVWGGVIVSITYAVSLLIRPFIPLLEEKVKIKNILMAGVVFILTASLGLAFVINSASQVIFWRVLHGIGTGFIWIMLINYQSALIPIESRGKEFAFISMAYNLPPIVFTPFLELLQMKGYFFLYALSLPIMAGVAILLVYRLPDISGWHAQNAAPAHGNDHKKSVSYMKLLKNPIISIFLASSVIFGLGDAAQVTFVLLAKEKGVPASWFFFSASALAVLLKLFAGSLLDRVPRKLFAQAATLMVCLCFIMASFSHGAATFTACGLMYGLGMGLGYPVFICLVSDLGSGGAQSRLMVLFGSLYSACYFVMPIFIERVSALFSPTFAYRFSFLVLAFLTLAVYFLSNRIYRATSTQICDR